MIPEINIELLFSVSSSITDSTPPSIIKNTEMLSSFL